MTRTVVSLGTYPIRRPVHGGQRRADAFRRHYESVGVEFVSASIYDSSHYVGEAVGPNDLPLGAAPAALADVPFIADHLAGMQSESNELTYSRLAKLVCEQADVVQFEQPFMWPLLRRAKRERRFRGRIIYCSHNVEAPLKDQILRRHHAPLDKRARIIHEIDALERELCEEADLIAACTENDAVVYRRMVDPSKVVVVDNGVDRPPEAIARSPAVDEVFAGRPFLLFVSSAYPPSVDGVLDLALKDGAYFLPPDKSIAICGAVSDPVLRSAAYQRAAPGNGARVQFFPNADEETFWALKSACHGVILPIQMGGGSNLKAAEALTMGKWIVSTRLALRGFDAFVDPEMVLFAESARDFQAAMAEALRRPIARQSPDRRRRAEALYWDRVIADSAFPAALQSLLR